MILDELSQLTFAQWVGIAGFVSYLTAFIAVQNGYVRGDTAMYSAWNVLSASMVLVSLTEHFNVASMLIQVSWIVVGTYGVLRHVKLTAVTRGMGSSLQLAALASFGLTAVLGLLLMSDGSAGEKCSRGQDVVHTASIASLTGKTSRCANSKGATQAPLMP